MSCAGGPDLIQNGLVLCLDAANRKSYSGSGTTWRDLSGNNNNGTLTNGPTFSSANGGSIVFDGVDDYIDLTNNTALNITTNDFTLEIFFYYQRSSYNYVKIASRGGYSQPGWTFYAGFNPSDSSDGTAFQYGQTAQTWTSVPPNAKIITIDNWWHACATRLNGVIYFYTNGILIDSKIDSYNFNSSSNTIIGASLNGSTERFKGRVACFRQYNRGLTPAEILQNYNATKGRFLLT